MPVKRVLLFGILSGLFLLPAIPAAAEEGSWLDLNARVVSLYRAGSYEQAFPVAEQALALAESAYGTDHPYFSTSLNNLAALQQATGRFPEAERLQQRALTIDLRLFGEEDPRVAVDRNNLQQLRQQSPKEQPKPSKPVKQPSVQSYEEWDLGHRREEPRNRKTERFEFLGWEAETALSTGYRVDNFRWNIAGNSGGLNPNILSELTWTHLRSTTANAYALISRKSFLAFRGSADYGWIFSGNNQDSDYLGDDRTFEFSRSNNSSDGGHLLDVAAGVGTPWAPESVDNEFRVIPLAGYSYHEQSLEITDGFQTIPRTGAFSGLDSRYKARWKGPWAGFDLDIKPYEKIRIYAGLEYHWASYLANARWNLRNDFSQPKSFRHKADGYGVVGSVGMAYAFSERWFLEGDLKLQHWYADKGIDRTFFSDGTVAETRFNEVKWNSTTLSLGVRHLF